MLEKLLVVNIVLMTGITGCCCHHTEVTCYSASDPCEPEGIPYYLPKPLLIVTKNFRGVEDPGVGQLGVAPIPTTFDNQAQYADVKANISSSVAPSTGSGKDAGTTPAGGKQTAAMATVGDTLTSTNNGVVPPASFKDGVTPDTFYTYHIVFVPDMTQKYKIKIKGGAGEFRAAMSLVNGWMFTGLGPFYLKDSSTAQNILACGGALTLGGRGVADVVSSLADLSKGAAKAQTASLDSNQVAGRVSEIQLLMDRNGLRLEPLTLPAFAEIHVFEAFVIDGKMEWRPIVEKTFDRTILGIVTKTTVSSPPLPTMINAQPNAPLPGATGSPNPAPDKPKTPKDGGKSAPSDSGTPPAKGPEQTATFDSQTAIENAINNAVTNSVAGDFVGSQAGQAQAAVIGSPAPAAGNNVTVNVNSPRCWPALCNWWPCCKPQPKNVQRVIIGPDVLPQSAVLQPGTTQSFVVQQNTGPNILGGPQPEQTNRVSSPSSN